MTMLRSAARKALWVTKGAAIFGGAVVALALVFGVASVALAANGQPFLLGRATNAATALTKLTANVNGAAMQVQNTNAGVNDQALSLVVNPGEAPMKVNSDGRVANLNSDRLDGKDSTQFLGADAKARDAARADFADTAGLAQNAQAAADADKLDGKSANEIGVNGLVVGSDESPFNSESPKSTVEFCPLGKDVVGTGYDIIGGSENVVVDRVTPSATFVEVAAFEAEPTADSWSVIATAICARRGSF